MLYLGLRERWQRLWQGRGTGKRLVDAAWADLEKRYGANGRFYHTLDHIRHVLTTIDGIVETVEPKQPLALQLAAFYHDVVYDPRADDNEEQSAQVARQWLERLGETADLANIVTDLILATKSHHPGDDRDAEILLDADLAILAAPRARYRAYAQAIRREFAFVPQAQYRQGRSHILQQFLQREQIYHTRAMAHRESQARQNMVWELYFWAKL